MIAWFLRLICRLFGHNSTMLFHSNGSFWCESAGGYDIVCERCEHRREETIEGLKQLKEHRQQDPRFKPVCVRCKLRRADPGALMCTWCGVCERALI